MPASGSCRQGWEGLEVGDDLAGWQGSGLCWRWEAEIAEAAGAGDGKGGDGMSTTITLRVSRRELATILAALRFHQDENLQGGGAIADQVIGEIATDGGTLEALGFAEVEELCQRLNLGEAG
jgi:hypothetical protein